MNRRSLITGNHLPTTFKCVVCDSRKGLEYTQFHQEAVCVVCEIPYSVTFFSRCGGKPETQMPRALVAGDFIDAAKVYFQETGKPLGWGNITKADVQEERFKEHQKDFADWLDKHPEIIPEGL